MKAAISSAHHLMLLWHTAWLTFDMPTLQSQQDFWKIMRFLCNSYTLVTWPHLARTHTNTHNLQLTSPQEDCRIESGWTWSWLMRDFTSVCGKARSACKWKLPWLCSLQLHNLFFSSFLQSRNCSFREESLAHSYDAPKLRLAGVSHGYIAPVLSLCS